MPKGPKGQRPPSIYSSLEAWTAKPERKKLNARERLERKAAAAQLFVQQSGRQAQAGREPNDRSYDRKTVESVRHMKPDDLDRLLRHGEEEPNNE